MTLIRHSRSQRQGLRAVLPLIVIAVLTGCATRRPESLTPLAPVASQIIWKIEEGDMLKT
jgi:uncharacterized lipoprotein YajG